MNNERCTVHKVSLNDPAASARDPALAALFRDGWTVISDIPIADSGDPHILLFLAPPRKTESQRAWWFLSATGAILGAASLALWIATATGAM